MKGKILIPGIAPVTIKIKKSQMKFLTENPDEIKGAKFLLKIVKIKDSKKSK